MYDLLIKNGRIVDGTGSAPYRAGRVHRADPGQGHPRL